MKINSELANEIASRSIAIIHHNVNVIDNNGIIVASGNHKRVGQKHGAAIEAIKKGARITINDDMEAERYENTEPGINHPIIIEGDVAIVIGISGNPAIIARYSELAILTAELLLKQASEINSSNWKKRVNDSLINEFIEYGEHERGVSALDKINKNSNLLNIETIPIIIKTDAYTIMMSEVVDSLLSKLSSMIDSDRIILLNHNEILLLPPADSSISSIIENAELAIASQLSSFKIGVGINACSPLDIRESVIYSRSVIDVGAKSNSEQRIYKFKDMAIQCLLKELESSYLSSFFNKIVNNLTRHTQGHQLIETLELFIENNAELGKTAAQLDIHRNTLSYRLSNIKKLTLLDPLKFLDLLQLTISIHCYRKEHPRKKIWIESII
ncbi:CdaR family transcriptional regulator [Oceanisphaera sp. IT1-181]|uniref:CdaR family transcriptional regulator n=1 Tax=Oceanisphaera sp. IT1-181 TaxID=3081199 RepID=UPI0029C9D651|nr:sugar diacid recognition domain-containing protein [Oceanisphaera sp. IT1-181]